MARVVHRAEVAAAQLEREGISAEIIDLRSLSPYDWEAIAATVRKTHRVIVAYEDMSAGDTAQKSPRASPDELFDELDAPSEARCRHGHLLRLPAETRRRNLAANRKHHQCRQAHPRILKFPDTLR